MKLQLFALVGILITAIKDGSCQCEFAGDECPHELIQFWLYKNETLADGPLQLDPLHLHAQDFEPLQPLRILIHGFTGNRDHSPNVEVRPVLLQEESVHVLSIDYSPLAQLPCYYPWAVKNAQSVGKCLAHFIDKLIDDGIYRREDIHLIGFSLGGQIAGLTANYAKHKLHRITGLDPARPGFSNPNPAAALDASDADFVDVIHTDPFLYGVQVRSGHADFFPNLEYFNQPGCTYWLNEDVRNCNHYRAPAYYAESITTTLGFWSYPCGNWWEFFFQNCRKFSQSPHALMGYFVAENATGSFFLKTNSESPFAKGFLFATDVDLEVSDKNTTLSTV